MIPNPEMILESTPKWFPKNYGMVIGHGTVDCSVIRESKDISAYVVNWFTSPILTTERELSKLRIGKILQQMQFVETFVTDSN